MGQGRVERCLSAEAFPALRAREDKYNLSHPMAQEGATAERPPFLREQGQQAGSFPLLPVGGLQAVEVPSQSQRAEVITAERSLLL